MHHDHDDGLVHGHAWASEPPRPGRTPRRPHTTHPDDAFDDGLVHTHGWACGERGRAAH
jgi:hypothetical protein